MGIGRWGRDQNTRHEESKARKKYLNHRGRTEAEGREFFSGQPEFGG